MENSFEIMTDSTAGLPEKMIKKYNIHVLALSFLIDNTEYKGYIKGEEINLKKFYGMMREKKEVKTSSPNLQDTYDMVRGILEGGKDLLYIGFSSGLSNTFQSITMILNECKEDYPDRKVHYVDSLAAALGQGLFVKYVINQREMGKSMEETYDWAVSHIQNIIHTFTVDDLYYLKQGGRISGTTAAIGTVLNVKPVLHVDSEGRLVPLMNVRGRKKALLSLVNSMNDNAMLSEYNSVYISHGDCLGDAEFVAEKVKENYPDAEIMIGVLDLVIGAHAGPGTVALFFYGKKR